MGIGGRFIRLWCRRKKKFIFDEGKKKKRKLSRKGDKRRFPIDFYEGKLKLSFAVFRFRLGYMLFSSEIRVLICVFNRFVDKNV